MVALCLSWTAAAASHEASYLVSAAVPPVSVTANGYVQTVAPAADGAVEVQVAVILGPIGSSGAYAGLPTLAGGRPPEGFELPPALRRSLRPDLEAWEAATRVLEWSAAHLSVDAGDEQPQDAASVLGRGRGRCSGVANATAALLLAAGFEAVTVSGLLVTDDGAIPHRWVACRLPGAGWVHTDPTLGLWTITTGHVAFADTVADSPAVRVLARGGDRIGALPRRGGRPVRPNVGAGLVCRVVPNGGAATAVAVLSGGDGDTHRAVLAPEGRFDALLPGRWRLVVVAGDRVVEDLQLVLRAGELSSITVELPTTPATGVGS
ncbi:MAG TPA: transglutaminase-like domain-containing protein [Thermoanaerobaculales bacterium]|nr:transglutaminase-like domain-containing protein [Thermoanaerobaculales bacterium]HQL29791.1 transglutaminase-like domain-containing protein [Thermoanaerobaculales bacterium]HQN97111.1 transglutaminase-like domain-containing protein [Thermoanaerobaculales bacterium]HQP43368.1 transglutaminase-like domain-containing protein [Thermoanaerobaculales bacterium]